MRNLIIGSGEIGKGLYKILASTHDTIIWDIKESTDLPKDEIDVLNICIPGNIPRFVQIVSKYATELEPSLVIIHSTVEPGTTREISAMIDKCKDTFHPINVVHSPVRGKHPEMQKGIIAYTKYVGYMNLAGRTLARLFLEEAGIKTTAFDKPETTELAKILSTTRYGLNLMFLRLQEMVCDKYELDFEEVYTDWEKTYNRGLETVGLSKYKRPIYSPMGENFIGGHCVVENAHMLLNYMFPDFENDSVLANVLSNIVQIGKGDRILEGF